MADEEVTLTVNENILCCSICLEYFKKPRSLPCLHSFCSTCLTDYVANKTQGNNDGFECPVCRRNYQKKNGDGDVTNWVNSFPVNHTLLSILDKHKDMVSSQRRLSAGGIPCNGCARSKLNKPAQFYCCQCDEYLCEKCKTFHSRIKATVGHKLFNIKDEKHGTIAVADLKTINNLDKCLKHENNDIKFYCKDHDKKCCEKCVIDQHRKCDQLCAIKDLVKEFDFHLTPRTLNRKLDIRINKCDRLTKLFQDKEEKLESYKDTTNKLKHSVKLLFNEFEDRLEREFQTVKRLKTSHISNNLDELKHLRDETVKQKTGLQTASIFGSKIQLFCANANIQKKLHDSKTKYAQFHDDLKLEIPQLSMNPQLIGNVKQALDSIKIVNDLRPNTHAPPKNPENNTLLSINTPSTSKENAVPALPTIKILPNTPQQNEKAEIHTVQGHIACTNIDRSTQEDVETESESLERYLEILRAATKRLQQKSSASTGDDNLI